ncbi:hypothetical protein [Burkholderia sp. IMCC1007]|uniref:hypothetical protein n=1 Tax=Burkholderia sp. IMCC1007 TaxID=3004104 RepID=UPI0022B5D404|nr:hypothetical protein [Burkholderia sp. IMCC1007]
MTDHTTSAAPPSPAPASPHRRAWRLQLRRVADVPPFIRSRYACGGASASDAPGNDGKPDAPMPAAVDAAERARVLDRFRTED